MQQVLKQARNLYNSGFKIEHTGIFINNEFVKNTNGNTIEVRSPFNQQLLCQIEEAEKEHVDMVVENIKKQNTLERFRIMDFKERAQLLNRLADLVEQNMAELVLLESLDCGKNMEESYTDMCDCVDVIRYFASFSDKIQGYQMQDLPSYSIQTRKEPYGLVGLITPWNYPLLMSVWKIAPALATGNCIILKPPEIAPLTNIYFGKLVEQAGFEKGVVNILSGYGVKVGKAISEHMAVNKVSFTGSTRVGREMLRKSGDSNLKKIALELGGKSPIIVLQDADLDKTATEIWSACFYNQSQNCVAATRIFIQKDVYQQILDRLVEISKSVVIGNSIEDENVNFGPLCNQLVYDKYQEYIKIGEEEGLELLIGGGRTIEQIQKSNNCKVELDGKGYWVEPTVYINVDDNSQVARNEIFAPIMCVMKPFVDINEAIERANDTEYGLGGAVFTQNMNKAEHVIRKLEVGTVWVNHYNIIPPYFTFGGYKQSGYSKDVGQDCLNEWLRTKAVYYKYDFDNVK